MHKLTRDRSKSYSLKCTEYQFRTQSNLYISSGSEHFKRTESSGKRNTRRPRRSVKNSAMLSVKSTVFKGVPPPATKKAVWKMRSVMPKRNTGKRGLRRGENEGWERNRIPCKRAWGNFLFIEYTLQSAIGTPRQRPPYPRPCSDTNEKADSLVS